MEGGKPYEQTGFHETWIGVRSRTKIHVSDFCPQGVNSGDATAAVTTVKRGVFFGANAWCWAFGEGFADGDHLDYSEMRAGHDMWSVQASSVFGCKTTIWNGQYFAASVVSSYVGAA